MKRRQIIKNSAIFLGATMSIGTISTILQGCKSDAASGIGFKPQFFDQDQFSMLRVLVDRIIPQTNTVGALDVGVDQFIDRAITLNFDKAEKDAFIKGITDLNEKARNRFKKTLTKLNDEELGEMLQNAAQEAKETEEPSYFATLKHLTTEGFVTSERAAKEFFVYDPVPGSYDGCMDWSEGTPSFAQT